MTNRHSIRCDGQRHTVTANRLALWLRASMLRRINALGQYPAGTVSSGRAEARLIQKITV